jgi:hypothetical protein
MKHAENQDKSTVNWPTQSSLLHAVKGKEAHTAVTCVPAEDGDVIVSGESDVFGEAGMRERQDGLATAVE